MNDFTRQEEIDAIDVLKRNYPSSCYEDLRKAVDIAIKALSAHLEIIQCNDCKYMTEHYDTDGNVPYWTCSEWDSGTDYDGFCHYAERRADE